MAASYLCGRASTSRPRSSCSPRHLPPARDWLLVADLGPALALVEAMRFGPDELAYLRRLGFARDLPRLPGRL